MTRLKLLVPRQWHKLLSRLDFEHIRTRGSHAIYQHPDGRCTMIPWHGNRVISRRLTAEILRQIKLSVDKYLKLIEKL